MPLSYKEATPRYKNALTNIEESLEILEATAEDIKFFSFNIDGSVANL